MAPELLRAHSTFSKSVDVYAFGVVAWEVAARKVPFDGLDPEAIVQRVTEGERPELPRHSCSPEVRFSRCSRWLRRRDAVAGPGAGSAGR